MSKRSRSGDQGLAALTAIRGATLLPEVLFNPTEEQRELKAKFWFEYNANPLIDDDQITPTVVSDVLGRDISSWTKQPHFWDWFKSRDIVKRRLEVAAEKASELAIALLDPSVPMQDSARVNLIKIVLEFAGRTPPVRKETKWHDKEIGELDDQQLDALIEKMIAQSSTKKILKNQTP